MPFSGRQRRTLRLMASLYPGPVRVGVSLDPGAMEAPELKTLRDWAALTPAVQFLVEDTLEDGSVPEIRIASPQSPSPLMVMQGWPRGYEFVSLIQAAYLLAEPGPVRRMSGRGTVATLYTAPTCPHSPVQLRHLVRALADAGQRGPLTVLDVTQMQGPTVPATPEVPLTMMARLDTTVTLVGVRPVEELTELLGGTKS